MIITPPREIYCSLEPKEVEIIENCITLLRNVMNKMDECNYSYLHISKNDEFTHGELTDLIFKLEDLKYIDAMY